MNYVHDFFTLSLLKREIQTGQNQHANQQTINSSTGANPFTFMCRPTSQQPQQIVDCIFT